MNLEKIMPHFEEVDLTFIEANNQSNHIVYKKQTNDETVYIIINNQSMPISLTIDELHEKQLYELYTDKDVFICSNIKVEAYSYSILKAI